MEHIAAIMLLVGCSQGTLACEELPAPQVAFETVEDCIDALPAALGGAGSSGRIVRAKCAEVDPSWLEEDVEISWSVTNAGDLAVEIANAVAPVPKPYMVAETRGVPVAR